MSVTITELKKDRRASVSAESGHESVRVFQAISTTPLTGPETIVSDPRIPRIGDTLSGSDGFVDSTRTVRRKDAKQVDDSGEVWQIDVVYRSPDQAQGGGNGGVGNQPEAPDPTTFPPVISKGYEIVQVPAYEDVNGNAIDNSAGEVFDPPLQRDLYDLVVRITRNERRVRLSKIRKYQGKVNNARFWGEAAKTWRIRITATSETSNGYDYERVEYELTHRADGWPRRLLDQGYLILDPSDNTKQLQITDNEGLPISAPVRLDGSGGKLAPAADPVFLPDFELEETADFSLLGLPFVS